MTTKSLATLTAISLATAFLPATVDAQADAKVERSVAGVWTAAFTPRNCVTGLPFPGAEFEGLLTFHKDGTLSVWVQNAVISVTRSPSHGLWDREQGWRKYSYTFIHLRYDNSGFFVGKQVATGTLELNETGQVFTADGSNTFYDVDGTPMGTGCAGIVGTRFGQ